MTRVEVEKECAKAGWELLEHNLQVQTYNGYREKVLYTIIVPAEKRAVYTSDTLTETYFEACRREGRSPF